jgi:hypothetical protein
MPVISAVFLALVAGLITAVPGFISELAKKGPKNIPLLIDVKTFWGHKLTRGEVFWFGLFIHLLMAALFGALYELIVVKAFVRPYHLDNLFAYASCFYLFVGGVIFPVVGAGLFGRKEGKTVWYELLIVHHLFAFFVWLGIYLFPALRP